MAVEVTGDVGVDGVGYAVGVAEVGSEDVDVFYVQVEAEGEGGVGDVAG